MSVGMDGPVDAPIPKGMVWNMTYDPASGPGYLPQATHEQLWERLADFLNECLPTAERAGVRLAADPDDPPLPTLRGQPRLVYRPELYHNLIEINRSSSNQLEFCVGTVAEMKDGHVYEAVDRHSAEKRIAYMHMRNVRGKVPEYRDTHR